MDVFRWIQMFSALTPMLQFTAVAVENPIPFKVTVGVDVWLPCKNVRDTRGECDGIIWTFSPSGKKVTPSVQPDGDRQTVTGDCSLHMKTVRAKDAGQYNCTQVDNSGREHGEDTVYDLQVFMISDGKETATTQATETTTASASGGASTKPKDWWWLYFDVAVVVAALIITLAVIGWRRTKGEMKAELFLDETIRTLWIVWWKLKSTPICVFPAHQTQADDNDADPEDGVSYSYISHTKKSSSNVGVRSKTDDDENAVTYATVKVFCVDSSDLHASVN
ncbi:hypothetical protein F2P81_024531 [Scophthalmus maximus]|uniref:Ig-like domain-containing protein n=1 Tax=Scophthalmus maximus TaxID=52904 RepID=A0A6A4RXV9_SCOMX|nr:hypothetical protein F2P81_024531 [Scophthalmus maximus]